jgi:hypothetical protein
MSSKTTEFAPWRKGLIGSSVLLAAGGAALYVTLKTPPMNLGAFGISASLLAIGGFWMKSSLARLSGKQIEQSSIRTLKLPDDWKVQPNYLLRSGGDIDLLIVSPDGIRYAVEIKSQTNVAVQHSFMGLGKSRLVDRAGKKLSQDAVKQAKNAAAEVDAQPVIWFPKGDGPTSKVDGVTVVFGNSKGLKKAIKAPVGWALF